MLMQILAFSAGHFPHFPRGRPSYSEARKKHGAPFFFQYLSRLRVRLKSEDFCVSPFPLLFLPSNHPSPCIGCCRLPSSYLRVKSIIVAIPSGLFIIFPGGWELYSFVLRKILISGPV